MYHDIVEKEINSIYHRNTKNFLNDLELIKKRYNVISFDDLLAKKNIKNNSIIITFDDMNLSHYENVFPLLKKYNFKATFFVHTNFQSKKDWERISEIANYRDKYNTKLFFIESHSHKHESLIKKNNEDIKMYFERVYNDIYKSKQLIKKYTNEDSKILSLPNGAGYEDKFLIQIIKDLKFKGIRSSNPGNENIEEINWYAMSSWPILSHTNQQELKIFIENRKISRLIMRIYKKIYKIILSQLKNYEYLKMD